VGQRDHKTINGSSVVTPRLPPDRHNPRSRITVNKSHRPAPIDVSAHWRIGPAVSLKSFSLHLRHRSRLGGLVYCMAHRHNDPADQSQAATSRPLRTNLIADAEVTSPSESQL